MVRCWRPVTTLMVAMGLLLAGCVKDSGWDQAMQALKDDPVATASWEGLEPMSREETSNEGHKPPGPSITRCRELTIPLEEAFSRFIATPEEHGWIEDISVRSTEDVVATKTLTEATAAVVFSTRKTSCSSHPDAQS